MDYRCVTTTEEIRAYMGNADTAAFDFETAPDLEYRNEPKAALDPAKSHICTMSISVSEGTAIMIPVAHKKGDNMDFIDFHYFLKDFLTDTGITKIAHNIAFESAFAYARGIVIQEPVVDTICEAQLTLKSGTEFRRLSDSGLKTLSAQLLGEELPSFESVTAGRHFDELDPADPETIRYSCADSDIALRLYHRFTEWFDRYMPKHRYLAEKIESPAAVYVGMMKRNGVPVDAEQMKDARAKADKEIARLEGEISVLTGGVAIGSNASTAAFKKYLYETLGLPVLKRTDKLQPSADDEAMLLLKDHCQKHMPEMTPLFDLIIEYRRMGKLKSTYLDGYLNYIDSATGCMHPDLLQLKAETGRFACQKPNLQNIPQKGQDPLGIRNFIVAPEGHVLLEADYSQAEIRLCAYLSQDSVLLDAYRQGADVHAITTSAIFHIPLDEAMDHSHPEYKHRRTVAKGTMFGIMYGIGGAGLSRNLYTNAGVDLSKEECSEYIRGILGKYTGMAMWQTMMKEQARRCMYIETAMGRRRYLPGIRSDDYRARSSAERMAINTPVQGLGADCLKHAMKLLVSELRDRPYIRPVLTVHDSLVFLVREDMVSEAARLIKNCMEEPPNLPDFTPLVAEVAIGKKYGELEDYENENK